MRKLDVSFPAWVLTGAWPGPLLRRAAEEFPGPWDDRWHVFEGEHEPMKRQGGPECWGPVTTRIITSLLSPVPCDEVARQLGRQVVVGDITGGGMHLSGPGARLDTHVDFDRHPETGWRRVANLLLYLNEGWREEWGGCLELDGGKVTVVPELGTMVLFETSDRSWHGHPKPIVGDHWRRSLAVYYYDPLDAPEGAGHSTVWRGAPGT